MKALLLVSIVFPLMSAGLALAGEPRRLSAQALAKAEAFVRREARPLEQRRLDYFLGKTGAGAVIAELAKFQNDDGGFGRSLEPDLRCPESSTTATLMALGVLKEVEAPADHPMVQAAVRYLVSHFDEKSSGWRAMPSTVTRAPHAPWWQPDAKTGLAPAETPLAPAAAVLTALYQHKDLVPPGLLDKAMAPILRYIDAIPDRLEVGEASASLDLAEQLPVQLRETLLQKTMPSILRTLARDRAAWSRYGLRPLTIVHSPAAPLYRELRAEVDANLDYLIETQEEDGGWSPYWSWEETDALAWKQASRAWRGVLVLENLRALRTYGRL